MSKLLGALLLTIGFVSVATAQGITVTPNPITFGLERIGNGDNVLGTITANDSAGDLIENVFVEGNSSSFFVIVDTSQCMGGMFPCFLSEGESLSFTVYFDPAALGRLSDNLVVEWNLGSAAPKNEAADLTMVPLSGTGISSFSASANPLDFGPRIVGTTTTMSLEIVNEINLDLFIDDIFVEGSLSPFSTSTPAGFVLTPGAGTTIQVSFQPQSVGSFVDDLVIVSEVISSKASLPIDNRIELSGEGIPQPLPIIDVDPLSLDFDPVLIGNSAVENLTITNIGTADLVVEVEVTGMDAASFGVPTSGYVLDPAESVVLPVTFEPLEEGILEANVRITSNDPNAPVVGVPLAGEGEVPAEPEVIDFGIVVVGEEATYEYAVENTEQFPLNMSVGIFEDDTGSFSATPEAFVLPSGERQTITFTYAPQATGSADAAVLIESEIEPIALVLQGEAVAPNIVVQNRSLNFGTVAVGTPVIRQVTVRNLGNSDLQISDTPIIGGSGQFEVTAMGGARVVAPDGSFNLEVTFTPTEDGPQTATLRILSNDPDEPVLDIALMGTSNCAIQVSENSLPFGDVRVGEVAMQEVIVGHTCADPVDLEVVVSGEDAFTVDPQGTLTMAAGVSQTLTVTFRPTGGEQAAILDIDDLIPGNEGPVDGPLAGVTVSLTGRGLEPDLMLQAGQVEFGTVTVGRTAALPFVLTNIGNADLSLSGLTIGGANANAFQIEDASASTLAPDATRTLNLTFSPGTAGAKTAILRIESDDPDTPQRNIALSGNGMEVQHESPATVDTNTPTQLGFQVPTDLQSASGQLFYRRGGEQAYASTPLVASGGTVEGQVPASYVTPRGVQYYAEFDLGGETITFSTPSEPLQLRVRVASLSPQETRSDFVLTPEAYRMVSFPLALDDPSVAAQFTDDYGPLDPSVWRMSRWNATAEMYQEYEGTSSFQNAGIAAWLVTNTGEGFDVENGVSRNLESPFEITLEPGWNQIGDPFLFPVDWSGVGNSSAVQGPYFFDGTDYQMGVSQIRPWDGYFVFNPDATPVTLAVPPIASESAGKQAEANPLFAEASYMLQIRADVPEQDLHDTQNFIGFAEAARTGWDMLDWPEPPGIGSAVRLRVMQEGNAYASAFKPLTEQGGTWDLELDVSSLKHVQTRTIPVQVGLMEHGVRPEGFERYVIDLDEGRVLPASEGVLSLTLSRDQPVRHLRVVIGTKAFAEAESEGVSLVPTEYALEGNYPNPFNPETVIRYSLNVQSTVELVIFNVLGQRIRTLVQSDQTSGTYEVRWDGRDEAGQSVASGVYIYRLQADGFTASRKMLLLR
ncbi:MAG TPA: choice-of-anchor D domain-containing protein [Rhodothermales bacterium]|nr:choice-of-anchor D domain-containing protein [Rhodothermales bacterium]